MQLNEYIFFNRVVVIVLVVVVAVGVVMIDQDSLKCAHLSITGYECNSCGVTRDFLSFMRLNFSQPNNQYSLNLFLYCIMQFMYSMFIASVGLKVLKNQEKQNSFLIEYFIRGGIKKVIIADAMITFLFGVLVFLPFWI